MAEKSNMEWVKRCGVMFWISFAAAMVLLILGRWYSSPGRPEPGYSAADTFSLVGLFAVCVMANIAIKQSAYLKQEIADLKSGGPDDSPATQDSE